MRHGTLAGLLFAMLCGCVHAQAPAAFPAATGAPAQTSAFAQVKSPDEYKADAWAALMGSLQDLDHKDVRVQALAALGLLGDNPQAVGMIQASLADPEKDIRLAAVLASADAKAPALYDALHVTLADSDATVAFSAARVLAKARDSAGENVLLAVSRGTKGTSGALSASLIDTAKKTMSNGFKQTAEMVKVGAQQSADLILSPFGVGNFGSEQVKKFGGDSTRMMAVQSLGEYSSQAVRDELIALLAERDAGVRAIAARSLAHFHDPVVCTALTHVMYDAKLPVKLTASAAYLAASVIDPPAVVQAPVAAPVAAPAVIKKKTARVVKK
jgi:HEAT repeat protein